MGMYGYPISEEEFKKDAKKEKMLSSEEMEEIVENAWSEIETDIEVESKENDSLKENVVEELSLKDKALKLTGLGPTFFERLTPLVSKEDISFLKTDMRYYSFINIFCYVIGMVLSFLSLFILQTNILIPIAFAFLFGSDIVCLFWKGRVWEYCINSYKSKKPNKHKEIEELAEEISEFRKGESKPPVKKWGIVKFCIVMIIGIIIVF